MNRMYPSLPLLRNVDSVRDGPSEATQVCSQIRRIVMRFFTKFCMKGDHRSALLPTALLVGTLSVLVAVAALNGGTAPTANAFSVLKTAMTGLLSSSWTLALAFVALVAAVWQIANGRGFGYLASVLGVMAVAFIGPTFVTSIATATQKPVSQIYVFEQTQELGAQNLLN